MEDHPSQPSVGVVVPVRNGAHLIAETLESILWQTYSGPVSIVVVDDGSTDGVADLVRTRWPGVDVLSIPPSGLPVGRNVGAAELTTDWLCFLDCDDLWHPKHLELLIGHAHAIPEAASLVRGWVSLAPPAARLARASKLAVIQKATVMANSLRSRCGDRRSSHGLGYRLEPNSAHTVRPVRSSRQVWAAPKLGGGSRLLGLPKG